MDKNKIVIKESLAESIAESIKELFPPQDIMVLIQQTKSLYSEVKMLSQKWKAYNEDAFENNPIQVQDKNGVTRSSRTATAYNLLFHGDDFKYHEILQLIVRAEIFIDKVREFFTGNKIHYTLGIRYYGELQEYNLSLLDMLQNAVVGIDSKSQTLKLRISKSKGTLMNAYQQYKMEQRDFERQEEKIIEGANSQLFDTMRNFWLKNKKTINGVPLNEGQLYETYRFMLAEGKKKGFDPNSKSDITYLQKIATRTIKNVATARQGGDVLDAQVKYYGASFASLTNIESTLKTLLQAFDAFIKSGNKTNFKQSMKKVFTKDSKAIDKIDATGQKEAKKHIDNIIKNISGVTFT